MKNQPLTPPGPPPSEGLDGVQAFRLLVVPLLAYAAGLLSRSDTLLLIAAVTWPPIYLVWCLWTMWRVTDRFPAEDNWRAVATLVFGASGWILVPLLVVLPSGAIFYAAFPIMFVPGAVSLMVSRRAGLAPLGARRRALTLWSAVAVCLAFAFALVAILTAAITEHWAPLVAWIAGGLCAGAGALAVMLGRSAVAGFTPGRPLTAESLLAEPTPDAPSP